MTNDWLCLIFGDDQLDLDFPVVHAEYPWLNSIPVATMQADLAVQKKRGIASAIPPFLSVTDEFRVALQLDSTEVPNYPAHCIAL